MKFPKVMMPSTQGTTGVPGTDNAHSHLLLKPARADLTRYDCDTSGEEGASESMSQ